MSSDYGPDLTHELQKMRVELERTRENLRKVQNSLHQEREMSRGQEQRLNSHILQLQDEMAGLRAQNDRFRQLLTSNKIDYIQR